MALHSRGVASSVESELLDLFRELLEQLGARDLAEKVSLDSSLDRDLGLGSFERVELLMRVEQRFGRRLSDETAQSADTPAQWLAALSASSETASARTRYEIVPQGPAAEPPAARDFVEVLRRQVERRPERTQIHLVEDDRARPISHGRLFEGAARVASGLIARGLRPGDTVAVMLPTGEDFFLAFLGVALAGGVAAPIYPPARPRRIEEYVRRQLKILANADARFLISFEQAKPAAAVMRAALPSLLDVVSVSEIAAEGRGASEPDSPIAETFFLQYTSGSTGDPKGVTLSHANVLANVRGIGWAVGARPDDVVVSWLPLYHDMGLIGSWLFSLYHGFPITILSPLDFLARPERWLWALSDAGGSLCPAPNFSYELCARKIEEPALEGVDLSRWRVAINAGEAVVPSTLTAFTKRFEPYGFRPESWVPCYGLAESSVALTFPEVGRPPVVDLIRRSVFETEGRAAPTTPDDPEAMRFVANGRPLPGHEIKVVDEAGVEVGERRRGRVLFRGPSKTAGYFRNPAATAAVVDAEGWMDSGDLGYLADGEIHITGRLKELIVRGGHNIIPQDVERAAEEVEGVRRGCVAAFGSADPASGTERVVVVAETRVGDPRGLVEMRERIAAAVLERTGSPADEVVLTAPHAVPKTSSGKIRRAETRRLFESGALGEKRDGDPRAQLLRLWLSHAPGGAGRAISAAARATARAVRGVWPWLIAAAFGLPARLLPSRAWAAFWIRSGLRMARPANAPTIDVEPLGEGPLLAVSNRVSPFDAAALAMAAGSRAAFADEGALRDAPGPMAFLLDPLLLDGPPGRLRSRVAEALREGLVVLLPADSPPGEPPERCRFRVEGFEAAAEVGARVVAVRLDLDGGVLRARAATPAGAEVRDPIAARQACREALAGAGVRNACR